MTTCQVVYQVGKLTTKDPLRAAHFERHKGTSIEILHSQPEKYLPLIKKISHRQSRCLHKPFKDILAGRLKVKRTFLLKKTPRINRHN